METVENTATEALRARWEHLKAEQPKIRIRNAARALNVSEAELIALSIGSAVVRLEGDWKEFLKEVKTLGKVMALTRNEHVVHERKGVYNNVSFNDHVGLVLDPDIDLRLFMSHWTFGYAVTEGEGAQMRQSFQFFDKFGEAVHKIYLTKDSDVAAFEVLTQKYKSGNQQAGEVVTPFTPAPSREMPDEMVDVAGFKQAWLDLKDTHDFYMMLGKFKVGRTQSLRLAPEGHAIPLKNDAIRQVLDEASARGVEIMVFVGNKGCIQIHTGPVKKVLAHETWYNVMDPDFNLHVSEPAIAQSWVVRKPTLDGIVTSVELFDATGELIVQFFGKRKPGQPELESWTALVSDIIAKN